MDLQNLLAAEAGNQRVVLDLQEVKLEAHDAVTSLACRETGDTKLRNCPGYLREWIDRTDKQIHTLIRPIRADAAGLNWNGIPFGS